MPSDRPDTPETAAPETVSPEIAWQDGDTPVAARFDDPYFAREEGRLETREVFLTGNGLPARWRDRDTFTIAELGFGTGLSFLETLALWRRTAEPGQQLHYVSFERYPLAWADLNRALRPWPDIAAEAAVLHDNWPPAASCRIEAPGGVTLDLMIGDANDTLPRWDGRADAWYLDGFSPAKNPDLWSAPLMQAVFDHCAPGGTFSTYTAAGWVRRNLAAAGFVVRKVPGFGRKRERLSGERPGT